MPSRRFLSEGCGAWLAHDGQAILSGVLLDELQVKVADHASLWRGQVVKADAEAPGREVITPPTLADLPPHQLTGRSVVVPLLW